MKKLVLFALIFAFLLTGCGQNTPPTNTTEPKITDSAPKSPEQTVSFTAKVLINYGKSLLLADIDGGLDTIFEVGSTDSAVSSGDIVSVTYNGMIMETYPPQLGGASVSFREKGSDLVGMYEDIFTELCERDSGLNSDINIISVDLSNTNNLSKAEKEGLLKILENKFCSDEDIQVVGMTFEQLKEENMLSYEGGDEKFPYFENGLLFTFPTEKESEKAFQLTVTKWRSPLGAYGFTVKASLKGNEWQYKIENEFIS